MKLEKQNSSIINQSNIISQSKKGKHLDDADI